MSELAIISISATSIGFAAGAFWMRWFLGEQLKDAQATLDEAAEIMSALIDKFSESEK